MKKTLIAAAFATFFAGQALAAPQTYVLDQSHTFPRFRLGAFFGNPGGHPGRSGGWGDYRLAERAAQDHGSSGQYPDDDRPVFEVDPAQRYLGRGPA